MIEDVESVFLNIFYNTEFTIARKLEELNLKSETDQYVLDLKLDTIEEMTSIKLNDEQKQGIADKMLLLSQIVWKYTKK